MPDLSAHARVFLGFESKEACKRQRACPRRERRDPATDNWSGRQRVRGPGQYGKGEAAHLDGLPGFAVQSDRRVDPPGHDELRDAACDRPPAAERPTSLPTRYA